MTRRFSGCMATLAVLCLMTSAARTAAADEGNFSLAQYGPQPERGRTCVALVLAEGARVMSNEQWDKLDAANGDPGVREAVQHELRKAGFPLDASLYSLQLEVPPSASTGPFGPSDVHIESVELADPAVPDEVWIMLHSAVRAPGKLTVRPMWYYKDGADKAVQSTEQVVDVGYERHRVPAANWAYSFEPQLGSPGTEQSPSMRIDIRSGGIYTASSDSFTRQEFTLTGNVPWGQPSDVASDTTADASGKVADYLELAYEQRTWRKDQGVSSFRGVARSTGRFRGPEVVVQYQPLSLLSHDNRAYFGLGIEGGWRKGDDEFEDPSTPAPERGNLVARAFGVLEWAPEMGCINRDLSKGLRFFVRGRGWGDTAKDDQGDWGVRLAGFVDTELLWNFDPEHRVFLRYEAGSLPPDLTERVGRFSVGTGTAF